MAHHIGEDKRDGPGDAGHAVNKNVGLFSRMMDEKASSFEVDCKIIVLMILARNIQRVGNDLSWMLDMDVSAGCKERTYLEF